MSKQGDELVEWLEGRRSDASDECWKAVNEIKDKYLLSDSDMAEVLAPFCDWFAWVYPSQK